VHENDGDEDDIDEDENHESDEQQKNSNKKKGRITDRIAAHTQAKFDSEAYKDFEYPPAAVWSEWSKVRQAAFCLFRSYIGRKLTGADCKFFASVGSVANQVTNLASIAVKRQWVWETVMCTQGLPAEYPTYITLPNYIALFEWKALPASTRGPFFGPQLLPLHPDVASDDEVMQWRTERADAVRDLYYPLW
jgi:hypothetical protein